MRQSTPPGTPTIAIVDDDEAVKDALESFIRSLGYVAVTFASALELLNYPGLADLSCLISDVQMAGTTGLELHDRLVAAGRLIPTILITAYPNEEGRTRAVKAGVVCYLKKPFPEQELLTCLEGALKRTAP